MDSDGQENQNKASSKRIRLVRPSVVILCGPAACGKSTFAERHFRSTQIISSDWARAWVCDDERDQRFSAQAFALVHFLIKQRLGLNRLCVVDSTALTAQARRDLLELAQEFQVPSVVLLFDIPLEKCVERDQKRERTVGRGVIERQYQAFEQTKAGLKQEGFDQVIELVDEDLGGVETEILFRPVARPPVRPPRPSNQGAVRPSPRPGTQEGVAATAQPPGQPKASNASIAPVPPAPAVATRSASPASSGSGGPPRLSTPAEPPQPKGSAPASAQQSSSSTVASGGQKEDQGPGTS
jgi:predicted kinase